MRTRTRTSLSPLGLAFALTGAALIGPIATGPAHADETTGTILAYDRLANILVLRDRTVWELSPELLVPVDMKAGDRIRIDYTGAGEDGVASVETLERVE